MCDTIKHLLLSPNPTLECACSAGHTNINAWNPYEQLPIPLNTCVLHFPSKFINTLLSHPTPQLFLPFPLSTHEILTTSGQDCDRGLGKSVSSTIWALRDKRNDSRSTLGLPLPQKTYNIPIPRSRAEGCAGRLRRKHIRRDAEVAVVSKRASKQGRETGPSSISKRTKQANHLYWGELLGVGYI